MSVVAKIAIFIGSFLAFFVQPLVGRTLLPYFGGSAAVWVTCLVAFQFLLLAGYGYAFLPSRSTSNGARRMHLSLLVVVAAITISVPFFKAQLLTSLAGGDPIFGVVLAVLSMTGLLSLVLSSNSTVVQSWVGGGREVYRLYAISNVGSFAGLLCYPLLVEPFVPVNVQWMGLGGLVGVYALLLGRLGSQSVFGGRGATRPSEQPVTSCQLPTTILWIALPAVSCGLMTSVTTHLTTDFVPLPLLWALLLALFLVSYVIGFSRLGEKMMGVWTGLSIPILIFAGWAIFPKENNMTRLFCNLASAGLLLLVVCSAVHATLCRLRPATDKLPLYYFCTALGGCIGGALAGVAAPLFLTGVYEYPIALILCCAALAAQVRLWQLKPEEEVLRKVSFAGLAVAALVVLIAARTDQDLGQVSLWQERGFFGVVSVRDREISFSDGSKKDIRLFFHGKTVHGTQLPDPSLSSKPTMYYSLNGGGIAFESYAPRKEGKPVRAGFVGMGVGTLASYGREGDVFRFYEISPEAIRAATNTNLFTFISDSKAKVEIVEGDARLELERDRKNGVPKFDLLFIDAYSGDSVPTHLITREAFDLYASMLKPDGIIALHLSNWHINLWPIVKAAAAHLKMIPLGTYSGPVVNEFAEETGWAFLSTSPFEPRMPNCCERIVWDRIADRRLMTDDYGSLIFNIRFGFVPPRECDLD